MTERTTFNFGSTELIQLVETRPCLWHQNHPDYKSRYCKDEAWREIYCAMTSNFETLSAEKQRALGNSITHKWYNIRDAFVKCLRAGPEKGKRLRPYIYHEYLEFYKKFYQGDCEDIEPINPEENEASAIERIEYVRDVKDVLEVQEENVLDDDDESLDQHRESRPRGSKRHNTESDPMAEVLLKLMKKNEDEDEAFFASILQDVKKMSSSTKCEFRIEVLKVIQNLKKKKRRVKEKEKFDEDDSE